jgi:transcription elongation factor GreB
LRVERPKVVETVAWATGNGDRSENGDYIYGTRRLREIDRRIRFLSKRLESAEVVDPNQQRNRDQVFFGATVTYASGRGTEMTITIVGIDEADLDRGQVSWLSPIARALIVLQHRTGTPSHGCIKGLISLCEFRFRRGPDRRRWGPHYDAQFRSIIRVLA